MNPFHRTAHRASRTRSTFVGGALALTLVAAAGCSGPQGGGGDSGEPDAESAAQVADMQDLIDQYSAQPEFTAPGPALDGAAAEGATIAVIAIDLRVPALTEVADSFQDVADQIGVTATIFDGQGNPTQVNQGMSRAIDDRVDAIISVGLPVQIIGDQIAAAAAAGIPVIDVINTPPQAGVPGQGSDPEVFGNVAPDSELVGRLLAASAIVQTDGAANVAIMNTSELTASPALVGGITDTLADCSACESTETDTALVDWATELPGQASSIIRSDPDVNVILPIYDGMSLFAATGVRQAGGAGRVAMASFNGTAAAMDLVAQGDIMVADVAQNNDWAAWAAMDQALRGILDLEPADPVLPIRYVGTDDLDGVDTSSQSAVNEALFGDAYRDGFLQLWGRA